VQEEIDPVIAGGVVGVAEGVIIEQVGQGGQWPVESADCLRVPIVFVEDGPDVIGAGIAQAWVFEDDEFVIQGKARVVQGVGVGEKHDHAENENDRQMGGSPNRWPQLGLRRCFSHWLLRRLCGSGVFFLF
jgi:hypothetical protein